MRVISSKTCVDRLVPSISAKEAASSSTRERLAVLACSAALRAAGENPVGGIAVSRSSCSKTFLQGLKRIALASFMSELKLGPPKRRDGEMN